MSEQERPAAGELDEVSAVALGVPGLPSEPASPQSFLEAVENAPAPTPVELSAVQNESLAPVSIPATPDVSSYASGSPDVPSAPSVAPFNPAAASDFTLPAEPTSLFGPSPLDLPPLETVNPALYRTPDPTPMPPPYTPPQPAQPANPSSGYVPPDPAKYETYTPPAQPSYPRAPYATNTPYATSAPYAEQPWQSTQSRNPYAPGPGSYPGAQLQPYVAPSGPQSMNVAGAAHWAALLGDIFLPIIGSIIVPAVIRSSNQNDPFIRQHATEALNYSITITLGLVLSTILTVIVIGVAGFLLIPLLTLIFRIQGAMAASRGQAYRYPINIRFIK